MKDQITIKGQGGTFAAYIETPKTRRLPPLSFCMNCGEVDGLHAPLLMHLAEEDDFISKAAQAQIKAALAKKPSTAVYSYPGQNHAFSRHNGTHYDAAAAALANGRTSDFLNQQLR
jgi:dienelactone hydrolase